MIALLFAALALVALVGWIMMQVGKRGTDKRIVVVRPKAIAMKDDGASPDEVVAMLLSEKRLPPGAGVGVLAQVFDLDTADALSIARPHLSERSRDVFDRMPTARQNAMVERVRQV